MIKYKLSGKKVELEEEKVVSIVEKVFIKDDVYECEIIKTEDGMSYGVFLKNNKVVGGTSRSLMGDWFIIDKYREFINKLTS